jgi:phosphatidylinositol alpha-1,6-mannosyltransferase
MPKILILTHEFPPFRGGIGVYTQEIAYAADEAGYQVTVFAPSYKQDRVNDDRQKYPFRVKRFPGDYYKPGYFPGLVFRTWRLLSREKVDIIHAVDIPFVMALAFLQKFHPVCFIASVHGAASLSVRDSSIVKLFGVSGMYGMAGRIVANSAFTKNLLLDHFHDVLPDRVVVSHLGVNQSWFRNVDQEAIHAIRKRYNINPEKKIILTVARLDERKGHRFVFDAIEHLSAEVQQELTYVIVGDGNDEGYKDELRAREISCRAQVVFTGTLIEDDLHAMYAGATVFCMPGDLKPPGAEGFGLVYLEAAAMGIPSIAFRIAAAPEVIRDGETGFLPAHKDIQGLSKAIERLMKEPAEVRRLGDAARKWASTFTWNRCVEQTYGNLFPGPGS